MNLGSIYSYFRWCRDFVDSFRSTFKWAPVRISPIPNPNYLRLYAILTLRLFDMNFSLIWSRKPFHVFLLSLINSTHRSALGPVLVWKKEANSRHCNSSSIDAYKEYYGHLLRKDLLGTPEHSVKPSDIILCRSDAFLCDDLRWL